MARQRLNAAAAQLPLYMPAAASSAPAQPALPSTSLRSSTPDASETSEAPSTSLASASGAWVAWSEASSPPPRPYEPARVSAQELACRWCLWSVEGIGPRRMEQLVWWTQGQVARLWEDERLMARVSARWRLSERQLVMLRAALATSAQPRYAQELERLGPHGRLLYWRDPDYPGRLLSLPDPPSFLAVRGDLEEVLSGPLVAMVGSREVSRAQERSAMELNEQLARLGARVISGGALGMDAAAHEGALRGQGLTAALLPSGLGRLAPRANEALFERIVAEGGALITEYPHQVEAKRYHFPRRNRLIAALTDGVVVLRARAEGGSMLTAQAARALGRPLAVVPHPASDEGARGSRALLELGAHPVVSAQDVWRALYELPALQAPLGSPLEPLDAARPGAPLLSDQPPLEGVAALIWQHIDAHERAHGSPMSVEALAQALKVPAGPLLGELTELELEGCLWRDPSGMGFRVDPAWAERCWAERA